MPIKLFFIVVLASIGMLSPANAAEFLEGKHYVVLDTPKANQREIREYFSFYCARCYSQQAFMKDLAKDMPRRAKFVKHHVDGIDGKVIETEQLLTKALITAEKMRMKDRVVDAIFDHIQKQKKDFSSAEEVKALFLRAGGSQFMFDSTFNSFSLDIQFEKMQKQTEAIKAQGVKNFPALIVNGRYKPLTSRITSMNEYKELIYFLLKK